ncbi:hypothetical protein EJB05_05868, partial [Eragrostis curvula]
MRREELAHPRVHFRLPRAGSGGKGKRPERPRVTADKRRPRPLTSPPASISHRTRLLSHLPRLLHLARRVAIAVHLVPAVAEPGSSAEEEADGEPDREAKLDLVMYLILHHAVDLTVHLAFHVAVHLAVRERELLRDTIYSSVEEQMSMFLHDMVHYYVVFAGRKPGSYDSWPQCYQQVNGFSGACYRRYANHQEAVQAFVSYPMQPVNPVPGSRLKSVVMVVQAIIIVMLDVKCLAHFVK